MRRAVHRGEIETIRRLAGEGRSDREIALALGRPDQSVVGRIRRREGIRRREVISSSERRRYTLDEDTAIRQAVASGRSSKEIALEIGRSQSSVQNRRHFKLVDAPHRGPRQIAAETRRDAHIQRLRERREARRAAEAAGAEA